MVMLAVRFCDPMMKGGEKATNEYGNVAVTVAGVTVVLPYLTGVDVDAVMVTLLMLLAGNADVGVLQTILDQGDCIGLTCPPYRSDR